MGCNLIWVACWVRNSMVRTCQSNMSLNVRSKGQGVNTDVTIVRNGMVGGENQEVRVSKVKLELVDLHTC